MTSIDYGDGVGYEIPANSDQDDRDIREDWLRDMTAARCLQTIGQEAEYVLDGQRLDALFGDGGYQFDGNASGAYRAQVKAAFIRICQLLNLGDPWDDELNSIIKTETFAWQIERKRMAEEAARSARLLDQSTARNQLMLQRIEQEQQRLKDMVDILIAQDVTHTERRGQLKLLLVALADSFRTIRYGKDGDVPF